MCSLALLVSGTAFATPTQVYGGGLDFHALTVRAEGAKFDFVGGGVSFVGYLGGPRFGAYMQGSLWRPYGAGQDGSKFELTQTYKARFGIDHQLGVAVYYDKGSFSFVSGAGLHTSFLAMNGDGYQAWHHHAVGAGLTLYAGLEVAPTLDVALYAAGAYDFADLVHGGDLKNATSGLVGLMLAARPGRKEASP